jgi:CRISPR-associated exonuclease Cas4
MYFEDDLLPISALQHLAFCERQWALIHLEGAWEENPLTVEGHQLHDRVHEEDTEVRGDLRIAHGLRLRSLRLGLTGKADVVEFHRLTEDQNNSAGVKLEGVPDMWKPIIVEYKHGKPKPDSCDEVQLCAQTLCLEEMMGVSIPSGTLFYGKPRRRYDVPLDEALRKETESLAVHLHELNQAGKTPAAQYTPKCPSCSLIELCLPKATGGQRNVHKYLSRAIAENEENTT